MPARKGSVRKNKARMKCAKCLYRVGLGVKEIARILGIGGHNSVKRMLQRSKIYGKRKIVYRGGILGRERLKERVSKNRERARLMRESTFSTFRPGTQLEWKGFGVPSVAERFRHKYRHDPWFMMKERLRRRLKKMVLEGYASENTQLIIGCTRKQLLRHIAGLFQPGMSWANYGQWHIDHMLPCTAFDLRDQHEAMMCFNFRNLRPLWAKDNIAKLDWYSLKDLKSFRSQFHDGKWVGNGFAFKAVRQAAADHSNTSLGV